MANRFIGGSRGAPPAPPQQDQFLLFSHMFLPKSVRIRGWHPPMGWCPPMGNPGSATEILNFEFNDHLIFYKLMFQGRIQEGPGAQVPQTPKMRPQHQNSTKLRPQNSSFGPLNNHFSFSKFLPCFAQHQLFTSNYLNFSRLTTLTIVLFIYVSMHQFILFSVAHISCTLYNVHLS